MSAKSEEVLHRHGRILSSPQEAFEKIRNGATIVSAMAAAEPRLFFSQLAATLRDKTGIHLIAANPTDEWECFTDPALDGRIQISVLFLTSAIRKHQGQGRVHYVPQHLSRWVDNMSRKAPVDVFWGTCTVPDDRGFVSLGLNACYEPEILRRAKTVVLEINPNMPTTFGGTHVPIDKVDHFLFTNHALPTVDPAAPEKEDETIGDHIAELIEDGSTLQLGIGAIPNALGRALRHRKDLGIHTELINDAMVDLYEEGVITGAKKTIWPGKMVGAFVYGSERLYKFVDRNPIVELQPASVVNDPYRIGRNAKMISVNTAVEIDITGQVCSESVGHRELSGVGGATDTHIGAQRSRGGRGIIAIRSITPNGQSKIVFELKPGAKVSISRNDIDTVVTEFGVAELRGRTVAERARALIRVAHPNFREQLTSDARRERYI